MPTLIQCYGFPRTEIYLITFYAHLVIRTFKFYPNPSYFLPRIQEPRERHDTEVFKKKAIASPFRPELSLQRSRRLESRTCRGYFVGRGPTREKKGQKDREKRKGEHKKNCTKRMTRPVRDHIGHTDLPGWQPPRGIPRRATFLPVNSFALRTASKESLMSRVIIFYHIANLIYSVTLINFIEDWY